ncbi:hypothetical protein D3C85_891110 [compost metagenome]
MAHLPLGQCSQAARIPPFSMGLGHAFRFACEEDGRARHSRLGYPLRGDRRPASGGGRHRPQHRRPGYRHPRTHHPRRYRGAARRRHPLLRRGRPSRAAPGHRRPAWPVDRTSGVGGQHHPGGRRAERPLRRCHVPAGRGRRSHRLRPGLRHLRSHPQGLRRFAGAGAVPRRRWLPA